MSLTNKKLASKRYLWQLTRNDVLDGVKAFMQAVGLKSGSILGRYDLYTATLNEWQKAKSRRPYYG